MDAETAAETEVLKSKVARMNFDVKRAKLHHRILVAAGVVGAVLLAVDYYFNGKTANEATALPEPTLPPAPPLVHDLLGRLLHGVPELAHAVPEASL